MSSAVENLLNRLMGDVFKAEKKVAEISKAIEVERGSLEAMTSSGKAGKKREYFETEIRNAFKRHHENVEKIRMQFDNQEGDSSVNSNMTEEEISAEISLLEKRLEALRRQKEIAKDRKKREIKIEAAVMKENAHFEKYKDYLQSQLDAIDNDNPISKRLAVLKEQEKQAQEAVSEVRLQYNDALQKMQKAEAAKREAEENARKAEKMRLQMQEEQKKILEAEERIAAHNAFVAQMEKEKQFYAERDRRLAQMTAEEKAELEKAADIQREKDREEAIKRSQEKARAHDLALQKKYEKEAAEEAEASLDDGANQIIEVSSHTKVRSVVKGRKRM